MQVLSWRLKSSTDDVCSRDVDAMVTDTNFGGFHADGVCPHLVLTFWFRCVGFTLCVGRPCLANMLS